MKVKDVLQHICYTANLDIVEVDKKAFKLNYIFPKNDIVSREIIECKYPNLLERNLSDGIHAVGRSNKITIPIEMMEE